MSNEIPRATVSTDNLRTVENGPVINIPCHIMDMAGSGPVKMHQAAFVNVAEMTINDGESVIVLMLGMPGCPCGCGAPGNGFVAPLPADAAIAIADQILELAGERQVAADQLARAALDRAGFASTADQVEDDGAEAVTRWLDRIPPRVAIAIGILAMGASFILAIAR
jgi:hypothetical protein